MNMTSHDEPTTEFAPAGRADPVLIDPVLDNMITNALEASSRNDGVTVGREADAGTRFRVSCPRRFQAS